MLVLDNSTDNTLGKNLHNLFEKYNPLTDKELIINPNSRNQKRIFLDSIDEIIIHDESVIFNGINGVKDFLNLNNVLSISIVNDDYI